MSEKKRGNQAKAREGQQNDVAPTNDGPKGKRAEN